MPGKWDPKPPAVRTRQNHWTATEDQKQWTRDLHTKHPTWTNTDLARAFFREHGHQVSHKTVGAWLGPRGRDHIDPPRPTVRGTHGIRNNQIIGKQD